MTSQAKGKIVVPAWVDNGVVKPLADDTGNIPVSLDAQAADIDVNIAGQDADVTVAQATPGNLLNGIHGYISSAWQKQPLIFGVSSRWKQTVTGTCGGSGTDDLYTTAVPSGKIYVLNAADCYLIGSSSVRSIAAYDSGAICILVYESAIASGVLTISGYCFIVLTEGDQVRARFVGGAASDAISLRVWGFIIDIT